MKKHFFILPFALVLLFSSCSKKADFPFYYGEKSTTISVGSGNSYLFSKKLSSAIALSSKPVSLQLSLEFENPVSNFNFCVFDQNNYIFATVNGNLSKEVFQNGKAQVSILLPAGTQISGFFITHNDEIKISDGRICGGKIGWSTVNETTWISYGENGGKLPSSIDELQTKPLNVSTSFFNQKEQNALVYVSLSPSKEKTKLIIADRRVAFDPLNIKHTEILNTILFSEKINFIEPLENPEALQAIIIDYFRTQDFSSDNNSLFPIKTDIGLIQNWPKTQWRNENFELFEWEQFPGILVFDFADYEIQDKFLKRLAFFVEKKGYIGILLSDEEIADQHGWNAHDYKAQSLADFFNCAQNQDFPLNDEELLLKQILLDSGVILISNGQILPGKGALISISQESKSYLRTSFLCHEGMHGVYFIDEDFRNFIYELYDRTDPKSIEFVKAYFTATPSLNYNIEDDYLMHNEFMGYLVQQQLQNVAIYFGQTLPARNYITKYSPELCDYMKETKAQGLVDAGTELDEYLNYRWGFHLGRTWKIASVPKNE